MCWALPIKKEFKSTHEEEYFNTEWRIKETDWEICMKLAIRSFIYLFIFANVQQQEANWLLDWLVVCSVEAPGCW